uniref:Uncharacterized protein n=1 Tax=Cyprinus carpio carpio TaxID=630221 RepID=A0A9J7X6L8_CYPCA
PMCSVSQLSMPLSSEIKYAVIGAGIGLFFSICFLLIKMYIIKKQVHDNEFSDTSLRRASPR